MTVRWKDRPNIGDSIVKATYANKSTITEPKPDRTILVTERDGKGKPTAYAWLDNGKRLNDEEIARHVKPDKVKDGVPIRKVKFEPPGMSAEES